MSLEVPVIDISSKCLSKARLDALHEACKRWGFFYIKNHGISNHFYHKFISSIDQLFRFPDETKLKLKQGPSSYTPRFILSPSLETFRVSGPDFSASVAALGLTQSLFGHHATEFSNLLDEYGSKMKELSKRLIQLLLNMLGDNYENKFYDSEFTNCNSCMRINIYSPQDLNKELEVEAFKTHTDISYISILFQDDVGGLEMKSKSGEWFDVRPIEDALVVNIGDFMEVWSNGRVRSAVHRVVMKKNVKRISIGFFLTYDEDDKEIYAPSELVGKGNSRLYRPFSAKEYRTFREKNYETIGATIKDFAGVE